MSARQATKQSGDFVHRARQGVLALAHSVLRRLDRAVPAMDGDPLLLGRFNTASASTLLIRGDGSGPGLLVTSSPGTGIFAAGNGGNPGVFGAGDGGSGVFGSSPAAGVLGAGDETGVVGVGPAGVRGVSSATAPDAGGLGVGGDAGGPSSIGVAARGAIGVYAVSTGEDVSLMSGGIGIFGTNEGTGWAARFDGEVTVNGGFVANIKSAAVPFPDGTRRRLYCMESPDTWFEDFGEARLAGGRAEVLLATDFAAIVDTTSYHVFVTPHDAGSPGLAVVGRLADRFEVRELAHGEGAGTFSYRIVARRKDVTPLRLATIPPEATAAVTAPERRPAPTPPEPPPSTLLNPPRS